MFNGQQMKAALLATATLLLLPSVVAAEVMDKEPSIEGLWTRAIIFGVVGLLAWRRGLRWGIGATFLSLLFVWGFYTELTDPFVGPDILKEAGAGYVSGAYMSFWVCAFLHLAGIALSLHRRKATNRPAAPVEAL